MRGRLLAVLLVGLVVRLALAPFGEFRMDTDAYRHWARRLTTAPLSEFYADVYASRVNIDHLPGDMWIMLAVASVYRAIVADPAIRGQEFVIAVKTVAALADVGIGLLLFLIGRSLGNQGAGLLAATLFTFNPASIFVSATWLAWDPVSGCLVLLALWLLLSGRPEWSLPVLTYATMIKPPFVVLAPLFALAFLHRHILPHTRLAAWVRAPEPVEPLGRSMWRALLAISSSVLVLVVTVLPFGLGLPLLPTGWSLADQLTYSATRYPYAYLHAFNVWALLAMKAPLQWPSDQSELLGLTYQVWGTVLGAGVCGVVLLRYARRGDHRSLVWACLALTFVTFMLPTRIHPRYLFPAFMLAMLLPAIAPRLNWLTAALTVTFLANLLWTYNRYYPLVKIARRTDREWVYASSEFVQAVALVNLALLLVVLIWWPRPAPETDLGEARRAASE